MTGTEIELATVLGMMAAFNDEEKMEINGKKYAITRISEGNQAYVALVFVGGDPWLQVFDTPESNEPALVVHYDVEKLGTIVATVSVYVENNVYMY